MVGNVGCTILKENFYFLINVFIVPKSNHQISSTGIMLRVRDVHRSNDLQMAEKIKNSRIVQLGRGVGRGVVVVTRGARGVGVGGSGGGGGVVVVA